MTTNPLPDLSEWPEVPADADIPEGVLFVVLEKDGSWSTRALEFTKAFTAAARAHHVARGLRYFTADPIPAPRPTPPTEPGTVLLDVTDADGETWERAFSDGTTPYPWLCFRGAHRRYHEAENLASWTVADVVPRKAGPLDENDHRDRVDRDGDVWRWRLRSNHQGHHWARWLTCGSTCLADINHLFGPLRFADEAQS